MTDLDELERKARAATPGPWRISDSHGLCIVNGDESALIADMSSNSDEGRWDGRREDAVFIVAARDVVLSLIARVRAAEADLAEARHVAEQDWHCSPGAPLVEHITRLRVACSKDHDEKCYVVVMKYRAAQARIAELEAQVASLISDSPSDTAQAYRDGFVAGQCNDQTLKSSEWLSRVRQLEAGLLWALDDIADTSRDVPGSDGWDWEKMDALRELAGKRCASPSEELRHDR